MNILMKKRILIVVIYSDHRSGLNVSLCCLLAIHVIIISYCFASSIAASCIRPIPRNKVI